MDKQQFLKLLRESLEGYIPKEDVEENISFYQNYFMESSKSEGEIIRELGDPRLIARTIIDAYKASKGPMADYYTEQARSEYSKEQASADQGDEWQEREKYVSNKTVFWIFLALICVVLFGLIFAIGVLVKFLLPILLVVVLVKLILDSTKKQ